MPLQLESFSESVRVILVDLDRRPFPLVQTAPPAGDEVRSGLEGRKASDLFPRARFPNEALSGLFLRLNDWGKSHGLSQELDTAEGSYWHGIAHRLEPDYENAGYWFRRVGQHAVFPQLQAAASAIVAEHRLPWQVKDRWDPFLFIRWCETAVEDRKKKELAAAIAIQNAEWELLFEWCGQSI